MVSRRASSLILGNTFQTPLADESVHCVVTAPRYWTLRPHTRPYDDNVLGNELSPKRFVQRLVQCMREVWRVLRPDGTAWLLMDDSNGGPIDRYDPTRGELPQFVGNLLLMPERLAFALQDDGWIIRQILIWGNSNPVPERFLGWRFLENGEFRRGSWRPTRAHEYVFMLTKQMQYWADSTKDSDLSSVRYLSTQPYRLPPFEQEIPSELIAPLVEITCPRWCCPVCGQGWAIRNGSDEYFRTCDHPHSQGEAVPGVVFDPFVGTGTTVLVAERLLRRAIGLDLNRAYLRHAAQQFRHEFER